jgi:hypothetical protein
MAKVVPVGSKIYYALFNFDRGENQPVFYIITGSKESMITKLNSAIKYFQSISNNPSGYYNFKYSTDDLEGEGFKETYISDDWALVTSNKERFEEAVQDFKDEGIEPVLFLDTQS